MSKNYDVGRAFEVIEDELIRSMIRNFKRHRVSEVDEGIEWEQWQALQLKALDEYKKKNLKYRDEFTSINHKITDTIKDMYRKGQAAEELALFNTFKRETNISVVTTPSIDGGFFKINTGKLEALINATTNDMTKAEHAVLRMVEDKYRSIIFNAQVYANTGAGTYEKAVDMATKDFLAAGINCIEYKNGARHTISNYSRMAIRTANKRAFLQGEGEKRAEWGISTVIINKRQGACPKCAPFVGKVLIDDVWSGGDKEDKRYPLMSFAIKKGLYHPNCLDSHSTYFPGISTADDTWTKEELEEIGYNYNREQKILYAKNQAEKFHRLAEHSLDKDNQRMYRARAEEWDKKSGNNPNNGQHSKLFQSVKLGVGGSNGLGNSNMPEKIGEIDVGNTDSAIDYFNEQIRDLDIENAVIIDKDGNVYYTTGTEDGVSITGIELKGATITHNHPISNGIVSFGEDDFNFIRGNQDIRKLICVNAEYTYSVSVKKDISKLFYSELNRKAMLEAEFTPDFDIQHKVFEILAREGFVRYVRKKIKP